MPGEHRFAMRGKGIHLVKAQRNRRRMDALPLAMPLLAASLGRE
jgi:hypothetical protein